MKADFGIMGLGVMGLNLALNLERNGFTVATWARNGSDDFINKHPGKRLIGAKDVPAFANLLQTPRRVLIMVKAGDPVDWTISLIKPHLLAGDVLIEGGNSYFVDTIRRQKELDPTGIHFVGMGVSGGETGALWGPSLMPGGSDNSWEILRPVLEKIAAQVDDGPCVTHVGLGGAGHFVKMVHNGIEYGDMQLIAESYDLMRKVLKLTSAQIGSIFAEWNRGILNSFLIEITSHIFNVIDPETKRPLVEMISDRAGHKGTGKWTSQVALDLGVAIPTIHAAIESRLISAFREERQKIHESSTAPSPTSPVEKESFIAKIHDALLASKICSYAQGLALISAASNEYKWNMNLSEICRIWKGGCIIRAKLLMPMQKAFKQNPGLKNLMMDEYFSNVVASAQQSWRAAVNAAQDHGVPVPAMSASLAYYDMFRSKELPLNLTQAQRDLFGAHTYERTDHPELGAIHTDWASLIPEKLD